VPNDDGKMEGEEEREKGKNKGKVGERWWKGGNGSVCKEESEKPQKRDGGLAQII
jgi:hypothetical protein